MQYDETNATRRGWPSGRYGLSTCRCATQPQEVRAENERAPPMIASGYSVTARRTAAPHPGSGTASASRKTTTSVVASAHPRSRSHDHVLHSATSSMRVMFDSYPPPGHCQAPVLRFPVASKVPTNFAGESGTPNQMVKVSPVRSWVYSRISPELPKKWDRRLCGFGIPADVLHAAGDLTVGHQVNCLDEEGVAFEPGVLDSAVRPWAVDCPGADQPVEGVQGVAAGFGGGVVRAGHGSS